MKVQHWLHDPVTYRSMMKNGFRIMKDLSLHQIIFLTKSVCEKNQLETVKLMVENGLTFDWWYYPHDDYVLYHATNVLTTALLHVKDDQLDIIRCLVEAAGPDIVNCGRDTYHCFQYHYSQPLSMAFSRNLPNIVRYLIERGANIKRYAEVVSYSGRSLDKETVQMMLGYYQRKIKGNTLLNICTSLLDSFEHNKMYDEFNGSEEENFKKAMEALEWLLVEMTSRNVDINAPHTSHFLYEGGSLGHYINRHSGYGDVYLISFLKLVLEHGLDINKKNKYGETILHKAVSKRNLATVEFLLENGAHINAVDDKGKLPIHHIFHSNSNEYEEECCVDILAILAVNGSEVNVKDNSVQCVFEGGYGRFKKLEKSPFEKLFYFEMEKDWSAELCVLLEKGEVFVRSLPSVSFENLKNYHWASLCTLVQSGCRDENLFKALLFKSKTWNSEAGYHLVTNADPVYFHKTYRKMSYNLKAVLPLSKLPGVIANADSVFSLIGWSVHSVRSHLFKVTGGKSILPRLRKLAQPPHIPASLVTLLTLDRNLCKTNRH